jgi:membrane protein
VATGTRSRRASRRSAPENLADRIVDHLPRPASAVLRRLRQEDVFLLSAGLAFYALVSVAPFAILVMWLASLVAGDDQVRQVADQLAKVTPPEMRVSDAFQRVAELGAQLGVGALVALLWPATAYGAGLSRSFERLCPGSDMPAKGLRGRALALALVGVMPALALAGLIASYVGTALFRSGFPGVIVGWILALLFGFVGSSAAAAAIYRLFAPRPVGRLGLWKGAATAGASIAVLSAGYAVFLSRGADFQNRYATSGLAAIVLLAVWLFLANALILVGYQVAQES